MVSDLEISVLMQYNKDISIESNIPIPFASNYRVYKTFVLCGYFDIPHALSLNCGQISGKSFTNLSFSTT